MTRKQLVLLELIEAKHGKKYQYGIDGWISGGWVPAYVLTQPNIGGLAGLRRLRELRATDINIEHRNYFKKDVNGDYYEYMYDTGYTVEKIYLKTTKEKSFIVYNGRIWAKTYQYAYSRTDTTIYRLITPVDEIDAVRCTRIDSKESTSNLSKESRSSLKGLYGKQI